MEQLISMAEPVLASIKKQSRAHLNPLGNWCGHDPEKPRFYEPPEQHGFRPDVIQIAMSQLEKFYVDPYSLLQSLLLARESTRKERTEARERDAMVLGIILHYLELATMRVGVPQEDGTFLNFLTLKRIALELGWRSKDDTGNQGIKRVWRALKNLKKAGYITVHRRFKRMLDGEQDYIGLPAVRCVATKLFYELGITAKELERRRKQAAKRLKKMYQAFKEKAEVELKKLTKTAIDAVKGVFKTNKTINTSSQRGLKSLKELEQRILKKEHELKKRLAELMKIPINYNKSREELINENPELKELARIEKALHRA